MRQNLFARILKYILILFIVVLLAFPLYWTITMVFKSYAEWSTAHGAAIKWWPSHFNLDNITYLFQRDTYHSPLAETATRPLINSIIVSFTGTALAVILGVLAAYGVSRYKVNKEFPLMLLTLRMFPPVAVLIPLMIMWAFIKFTDTWYGLSLVYALTTLPFGVWLMLTFFEELPNELTEAAIVDGCSNWQAFIKVILPLAKGGIASTALFCFILNWSDYAVALTLTSRNMKTAPVFLGMLQNAYVGEQYGPKAALGIIAVIVPVVIGIAIQKYLVRGLTFGAIKK
jgi:multiple sugar transport system permease protein